MDRFLALLALFCALLATPLGAPRGAFAAEMDHGARINLAGRQRMLTQQMAKATCFIMAGVEPERHADMAWIAENAFATALGNLRNGLPSSGILAATEPEIAAQLAVVAEAYKTYGAAVQQLIHGDRHTIIVSQLFNLNTDVLAKSHAAVQLMQAAAGNDGADPKLAKTVNVAGRQRMLSQFMAKSFCFVALDINTEAQRAALSKAISDFDTVLGGLQMGDAAEGLMAPPNPLVHEALARVAVLWEQIRPAFDRAAKGAPLLDDDMARVASLNDPLLREMNMAVVAYLPSD